MKIIKFLRKPYLSVVMASIFLFMSCNQYDTLDTIAVNKFDYSAFEKLKSKSDVINKIVQSVKQKISINKSESVLEVNTLLLNEINVEFGTELILPDEVLEISTKDMDSKEIIKIALENNWMNQEDVELIESFGEDIQTKGFDIAVENYENIVEALTLTSEEFSEKNSFLNGIKIMEYDNPELFDGSTNRGWLRCLLATIVLAAAIGGATGGCATILACGLALTGLYFALDNFAHSCF